MTPFDREIEAIESPARWAAASVRNFHFARYRDDAPAVDPAPPKGKYVMGAAINIVPEDQAVARGKAGGRAAAWQPRKRTFQIDVPDVLAKRADGVKWTDIAAPIGCTVKLVEARVAEWKRAQRKGTE